MPIVFVRKSTDDKFATIVANVERSVGLADQQTSMNLQYGAATNAEIEQRSPLTTRFAIW
jgi:hypothetical protein